MRYKIFTIRPVLPFPSQKGYMTVHLIMSQVDWIVLFPQSQVVLKKVFVQRVFLMYLKKTQIDSVKLNSKLNNLHKPAFSHNCRIETMKHTIRRLWMVSDPAHTGCRIVSGIP